MFSVRPVRYANQSSKKMNSMFFSFVIVSLCIFSFKVVAIASAEVTTVNKFWKQLISRNLSTQLVTAEHMKMKFKLHKNVSPIKFSKKNLSTCKKGAIKIRPLSFYRTLLALRVLINWNEHASKGTTPCFQKIRGFCFTFCLSSKK